MKSVISSINFTRQKAKKNAALWDGQKFADALFTIGCCNLKRYILASLKCFDTYENRAIYFLNSPSS